MNNSFDNYEINEPDWLVELKNNYRQLYFNTGIENKEVNKVVSSQVTTAIAQEFESESTKTNSNEINDQFVFKQPASVNTNKRSYVSNRMHSTEQIHTHNNHQQLEYNDDTNVFSSTTSNFDRQRKSSNSSNIYNNTNNIELVQMYQPQTQQNSSAADYTSNQAQNGEFQLSTHSTMSAMPTANQAANENNYNSNSNEFNIQNDQNSYENNQMMMVCIKI